MHTPGPWKVIGSTDDIWVDDERARLTIVTTAPDKTTTWVAQAFSHCGNRRTCADGLAANARLIASAPALLKALEGLTQAVRNGLAQLEKGEFVGVFGQLVAPTEGAEQVMAEAKGE